MLKEFAKFDLVLVQTQIWWGELPKMLASEDSPESWITEMLPTVYTDSLKALLIPLSLKTKTALVLGHVGVDCHNKREPEELTSDGFNVPDYHGWPMITRFWSDATRLVHEANLAVEIVDVRAPLMSSVHAHVGSTDKDASLYDDCFHFCMNSAAVNAYLDRYQVALFDKLFMNTPAPQANGFDLGKGTLAANYGKTEIFDDCDFIECMPKHY